MIQKAIGYQPKAATVVDLVRKSAEELVEKPAFRFLLDGEDQESVLSYQDLDRHARAIAVYLQYHGGPYKRILLLYPPSLDYISAFLGCLYAGAIAIPTYPPDVSRLERSLPRFLAIVNDAQPDLIMTTSPILAMSQFITMQHPKLQQIQWIATDMITSDLELGDDWQAPPLEPDSLAFLQYTSGSTADPKGVMLSHGNLIHQLEQINQAFRLDPEKDKAVFWLPFYHDMGLIGGILGTLYSGASTTMLSPLDFLQRPYRWLNAISKTKATVSGGPNFAYDLCIRKITDAQKATLDLSNWKLAFNGAEPVRADTMKRFAEAFAVCGFRIENFYPCYGLAEATLLVTGSVRNRHPKVLKLHANALSENKIIEVRDGDADETVDLVGCGFPYLEQEVVIVDPETQSQCPVDENQATLVGEIWVSGLSVAQGYWNKPEESEKIFRARLNGSDRQYLRTGDLGFIKDGQLFVTGRVKDLIIIDGLNHYPQDIELTVEQSHPALRPGCSAAFSVEINGREELIVVAEVAKAKQLSDIHDKEGFDISPNAIMQAVKQAISANHDLKIYDLVLLKPGSISKTSSGKIQRHASKKDYLARTLDIWQP